MRAFLPPPADARLFTASRLIRSTDVTPAGRLRFDALARYLQQAAENDLADSGCAGTCAWFVRKTAIAVRDFPRFGDRISLRTFCSATGPAWAERTTTVSGPGGDLMQATAVWAAVSLADGRPVPLDPDFRRVYGGAAAGRTVSARLTHPRPPADLGASPWPLRASDFDTAGHVNNAIHWAAAEDVLAGLDWLPDEAELEYHRAMQPGCAPSLAVGKDPAGLTVWLLEGGTRLASARLLRGTG
jgi:acyl-ACP thioesterase